ncbi:putative membrane protein [Clostridium argentinense CDC 2741]|uniref:Putative membrane protein n=1 Tax=Clostridium argentinense CDC 2741 TaxID=1418104 RepID=A0A0C1UEP2_9CLOT|nr:hypothetical protein [Clostridium argentinense]ARC83453.1 hypothetical protein RSJ17_02300 [Clostridium argentinense]KIE45840.1 putative membrane protein [Clostridium argentinense CDC 2741]NFF39101.1 hypothetical protein [Clostridium argentinense]NFP49513.1 hypothetical protein [Clostridium argentinense]NFP72216.1 hypothetical protein [Clostridium argentinense]
MFKTKDMVEAAMLSALFVVLSVIAIGTGIGYSLYLDILVPLIISLIYLKCGLKYTVLSAITSLIIIILGMGNIGAGIWMSQSMILGLMCSIFIEKDGQIIDDMVYCSIFACILMIFIDIYFSKLIGYSFIKEFEGYATSWSFKYIKPQVILYVLIACVPAGTVVVTYLGTLVLGNKLKLLNEYGNEKFKLIKSYRKVGYYMCCSKKIIIMAIAYLASLEVLNLLNYDIKIAYIRVIAISIKYTLLYVVLKDANSFIGKFLYMKTKSKLLFRIVNLSTLILLVIKFKLTSWMMILGDILINLSLNMRNKQLVFLKKCI